MALEAAGVPLRIVSTSICDYGKGSPWHAVQVAQSGDVREGPFTRNIPADEPFVNVVCEVPRAAARMWTLGHVNIAIAAIEHELPPPTKGMNVEDVLARFHGWRNSFQPYRHFDHVVTPSPAANNLLHQMGIDPITVGWADLPGQLEQLVAVTPKTAPPDVDNTALEATMDKVMAQNKDAINKLTTGTF